MQRQTAQESAPRGCYAPMSETMLYILFSLQTPRHGYGIMQHVARLTSGRIRLGAGTLYTSLTRLLRDGLILPAGCDGRRKRYILTQTGADALQAERQRIRSIYMDIN